MDCYINKAWYQIVFFVLMVIKVGVRAIIFPTGLEDDQLNDGEMFKRQINYIFR